MAGADREPRRGTEPGLTQGRTVGAEIARRKVLEQLRNPQALVQAVLEASRGSVYLHTCVPGTTVARVNGEEGRVPGAGFMDMGDNNPVTANYNAPWQELDYIQRQRAPETQPVMEVVAFTPATRPTYTTETQRRGFRSHEVPVRGPDEQIMVTNPLTGQEEPAVHFGYQFNIRSDHAHLSFDEREALGIPIYHDTSGTRDGNMLRMQTLLPQSIAEELQTAIQGDPENGRQGNPALIRHVVEEITLSPDHGGMPRELWTDGDPHYHNPARPPYDALPENWQIHIAVPAAEVTPTGPRIDVQPVLVPTRSERRDERNGSNGSAADSDARTDTAAAAASGGGDSSGDASERRPEQPRDPVERATELYLAQQGVTDPTAADVAAATEYIEAVTATVQGRLEGRLADAIAAELTTAGVSIDQPSDTDMKAATTRARETIVDEHNTLMGTDAQAYDDIAATFVQAILEHPQNVGNRLADADVASTAGVLAVAVNDAMMDEQGGVIRPDFATGSGSSSSDSTETSTGTDSDGSAPVEVHGEGVVEIQVLTNDGIEGRGPIITIDVPPTTEGTSGGTDGGAGDGDGNATPDDAHTASSGVDSDVALDGRTRRERLDEVVRFLQEQPADPSADQAAERTTPRLKDHARHLLATAHDGNVDPEALDRETQRLQTIIDEGITTVQGSLTAMVEGRLADPTADQDRAAEEDAATAHLLSFYSTLSGQEITNLDDIPHVMMAATIANPEAVLANAQTNYPENQQLHDQVAYIITQTLGEAMQPGNRTEEQTQQTAAKTTPAVTEKTVVVSSDSGPEDAQDEPSGPGVVKVVVSAEEPVDPAREAATILLDHDALAQSLEDLTPERLAAIQASAIRLIDYPTEQPITSAEDARRYTEMMDAALVLAVHLGADLTNLREEMQQVTGPLTPEDVRNIMEGIQIVQNAAVSELRHDLELIHEAPNVPDVNHIPDIEVLQSFVDAKAIQMITGKNTLPESMSKVDNGARPELMRVGDKVLVVATNSEGTMDVAVIQSTDSPDGVVILENVQTETVTTRNGRMVLIHTRDVEGRSVTHTINPDGQTNIFPSTELVARDEKVDREAAQTAWRKIINGGQPVIGPESQQGHSLQVGGDKKAVVTTWFATNEVSGIDVDGKKIALKGVVPRVNADRNILEYVDPVTQVVKGELTPDGKFVEPSDHWKSILLQGDKIKGPNGQEGHRIRVGGQEGAVIQTWFSTQEISGVDSNGQSFTLQGVKPNISKTSNVLEFVDVKTGAIRGELSLTGRFVDIPAPSAAVTKSPQDAELERLRAQVTELATAVNVMRTQQETGLAVRGDDTKELPEAPRDVPRAPEKATGVYRTIREKIQGPVGPSQYPHPTYLDDVRANVRAAIGELKSEWREFTGKQPGPKDGWKRLDDVPDLLSDPYPGNYKNAGRLTLGVRDGKILKGPRYMGALIAARSGKGKTHEILKPMVADYQGMAVVEAPPDLLRDTFNARLQWGPNQVLALSSLRGEMVRRYGDYRVSWPLINEFSTYDDAVRIIHDLSHDQNKGKSAGGGDSHSTYWQPLGEALGASLGYGTFMNGDDLPKYVERLRLLNVGLQYSESGVQAPPKVRTEMEAIFAQTGEQIDAAMSMIAAKMGTATGVPQGQLQAQLDHLTDARYGLTLAQQEFSANGALHPKTASTVASVARTIIIPFRGRNIQMALSRSNNELDPHDLTPHTVYVHVDDKDASLFGKIQRAVHNRLTGEVKDRYAETLQPVEPGVAFFVDEGGVTEQTELAGDIVTMRKMGAATVVAGQTAGMLIRSMGEEAVEAMLSNNEVILGRGADPKAVDIIAKQVGTIDKWENKERFSWWDRTWLNPRLHTQMGENMRRERINITKKETKERVPKLTQNHVVALKEHNFILVHDADQIIAIEGQPYHLIDKVDEIPKAPEKAPDSVRATATVVRPVVAQIEQTEKAPALGNSEAPNELRAPEPTPELESAQPAGQLPEDIARAYGQEPPATQEPHQPSSKDAPDIED